MIYSGFPWLLGPTDAIDTTQLFIQRVNDKFEVEEKLDCLQDFYRQEYFESKILLKYYLKSEVESAKMFHN